MTSGTDWLPHLCSEISLSLPEQTVIVKKVLAESVRCQQRFAHYSGSLGDPYVAAVFEFFRAVSKEVVARGGVRGQTGHEICQGLRAQYDKVPSCPANGSVNMLTLTLLEKGTTKATLDSDGQVRYRLSEASRRSGRM